MERIEDVILRHSMRGMTLLRDSMEENFCERAAGALLELEKGTVFLTTGFYVAGFAETDGPLGTLYTALALEKLGWHSVIVTDEFCRDFFEPYGVETVYADLDAKMADYQVLLEKYRPKALISIERCGENVQGDYANMRGVSIAEHTAAIDRMFELAAGQGIPTFGVGDGGNEIGMGNLKDVITEKLSLVPCRIGVDYLIIATVSNWGAYGLVAWLEKKTGEKLLPEFGQVRDYLAYIVSRGSVDGVKKEAVLSVDGFSLDVEKEVIDGLHTVIRNV
ncbi:MAG: DUF4392 domain-containing protein [Candidatus Limivivens sp.]|nr:DUF4392 domain-containing protein [Candidatus Limivivens sp.]